MKNNHVLYNVAWIIGALVLVYLGSLYLDYANEKVSTTYDGTYILWAQVIVPFVLGVYLGIMNGFPRRVKFNKSKMIIFIPSFLLMLYAIAPYYIQIPYNRIYLEIMRQHGHYLFGIISGMTFISGLFETKHKKLTTTY